MTPEERSALIVLFDQIKFDAESAIRALNSYRTTEAKMHLENVIALSTFTGE